MLVLARKRPNFLKVKPFCGKKRPAGAGFSTFFVFGGGDGTCLLSAEKMALFP